MSEVQHSTMGLIIKSNSSLIGSFMNQKFAMLGKLVPEGRENEVSKSVIHRQLQLDLTA